MGAADIIPGVSGGTVALILGHYDRLVTAISHIDTTALRLVFRRRLHEAFEYVDGRFLAGIGCGVVAGILSLASLMHMLLENRFSETMAIFFGLILASSLLVARMISKWTLRTSVAAVAGAAVAWAICAMTPTTAEPTIPYVFLCANIAICAMILPGISGAFVLLLLGIYHPITGMLRGLLHGEWSIEILLQITVFVIGCATGLATFSRILRLLLRNYRDSTFALLMGLMVGSLRKLWPLQQPTTETATLEFKERQYEWVSPAQWDGPLVSLVMLVVLATMFVFVSHLIATRLTNKTEAPQ